METQERTIHDSWNGLGYPEISELIRSTFRDVYNRLGAGSYVEKTWAELKALKDGAGLSPGTYYRITDYVATTTQENTRSAGHAFDIIVVATGIDTLSEDALAIQHQGDTYFQNSNLAAWRLSYCIDNDQERFFWADPQEGKGVVYRLIDEWNNDIPYDFKGIQFKRWLVEGAGEWDSKYVGVKTLGGDYSGPAGYNITDESDFIWMYTFSGVRAFWNEEDSYIEEPDSITNETELFDLSIINMNGFYDENNNTTGCCNNTFKCAVNTSSYINSQFLNDTVFTGWAVDLNSLPEGYQDLYADSIYQMMSVPSANTFGVNAVNNTFGNDCNRNTFGNSCSSNTFGNSFYSNTFGNSCQQNTFGNDCYGNTFGNNCYSNTFGNYCSNNTFGNYCSNNTFGNNCFSNTFGNSCSSNTFGNGCQQNTFGNSCSSNTFGNNCFSNTFGNSFYNNTFGNNCQYGTVDQGVQSVSVTANVRNFNILSGTKPASGKLTIGFQTNRDYPQFAGLNSSKTLKVWTPADMVD